jgi:3-oxoacyl-[acyl-carrier-protein] synthase-1
MSTGALAIVNTGLVTSVGQSAAAACAAMRAKISNPTPTRFTGADGEPVLAHQVLFDKPWRDLPKLTRMVTLAIVESLREIPASEWPELPLLLCVAEPQRPGRIDRLEERLIDAIGRELNIGSAPGSGVLAHGRVGVPVALAQARKMLYEQGHARVLIAAVDSLLRAETIAAYEADRRLLAPDNSDGFMVGEGASALLVARAADTPCALICHGLGFAREAAHISSEQPLRGEGLARAHKGALADAACEMHDLGFRITDLSGEQFYFKEASLALSRVLRTRMEDAELWHPAEVTGAAGAALGGICIALAREAMRKQYAPSPGVLLHFSEDNGHRASIVAVRGSHLG